MNGRERIAQILFGLTAIFAIGNGVFMLIDPFGWYNFVGTVKATGPANSHFLRDIGIAYVVSGLVLVYASLKPSARSGLALIGGSWLLLHGILHIYEVINGICSPEIFWQDAPGVLGPPLLVVIGLVILKSRRQNTD
jgi:hypothetical protein